MDAHDLPDLLPDKSYSPASIGKAYLRKIQIEEPSIKFSDFPARDQGIAMAGYFGGRAEVHIRRTKVPVLRLDFVSQYPTVNTLMRNQDVLLAESVSFEDETAEIQKFLNTLLPRAHALDECFKKKLWLNLKFFALVKPARDIFPVRAPFDADDPQSLHIASSFFTSEKPLWLAGPDIVASIVLTGKIPKILKAVRLVPHGKQKGMQAVKLLGEIPFDPYKEGDDFFKLVIEAKERASKDAAEAKRRGDKAAEAKAKALKHALKIIANSTSYGAYVELNEQKQSKPASLEVHSGEDFHSLTNVKAIEAQGSWYFAPLAALITAGSRLLLAMAEACVTEAGGTWMAADTDSIMVVASKKGGEVAGARKRPEDDVALREGSLSEEEFAPIPALSHETAKKISERFASLNPYEFPGTILKIEDVNYQDEDSKKPLRTVYAYGVSAKRYCLWIYERGKIKIVDAKGHGLGFLRPPVENPKGWNKKWPYWIELAWLYVLRNEQVTFADEYWDLEWLDRPAMMQIPVSSPAVLGRLKNFTKPYDFVLAPIVRETSLSSEQQAEKPILITRFTKNSSEWLNAEYFNVRTGEPCRISVCDSNKANVVRVKSYRQILNAYPYNPEHKSLAPGGQTRCDQYTRGILERDHIIANQHIPCGKERKSKLDQGLIEHPDASENSEFKARYTIYHNGRGMQVRVPDAIKERMRKIGSRKFRRLGIGPNTYGKALHSTIKPRTYKKILAAIEHSNRDAFSIRKVTIVDAPKDTCSKP